jgi:hypothetical protein
MLSVSTLEAMNTQPSAHEMQLMASKLIKSLSDDLDEGKGVSVTNQTRYDVRVVISVPAKWALGHRNWQRERSEDNLLSLWHKSSVSRICYDTWLGELG